MSRQHFFFATYFGLITLALAMLSACIPPQTHKNNPTDQPATQVAQSQTMPAASSPATVSQRIIARLNGLSGEQDPRLTLLKQRIAASAGITLLSLGTAPTGQSNSQQAASAFSAFLTFQFDPTRMSQDQALAFIQGLETFAYIEADQPLQKR
jgi:hypothetical protein